MYLFTVVYSTLRWVQQIIAQLHSKRRSCSRVPCTRNALYSPASRRGRDKRGFHSSATNSLNVDLSAHVLPHVAISCHMLSYFVTFCTQFPKKVHDGELQHFCDDTVRPDPVWRLSREGCRDDLSESPRSVRSRKSPRKHTANLFTKILDLRGV